MIQFHNQLCALARSTPPRVPHLHAKALLWLGALLVVLALAAPAADAERKKKKETSDTPPPVFYPDLPEIPRIQFLRTFNGAKDVLPAKTKKGGGFRKFIVGDVDSSDPEMFTKPYGVAMGDGKIFVCDTKQNSIAVLDIKGEAFSHLGRDAPGVLKNPINLAIDADGTFYVADNALKRIMVYDADGRYSRSIGDPEKIEPTDVAILDDNIYVCDIANHQIAIFDKKTGEERERIGSRGIKEDQFLFPTHVAVDLDGYLYVSDTGQARIVKFDPRGKIVDQIGSRGLGFGQFVRPKGIAVDREDRLYVVDAAFENVQIFDRDGALLLPFGGPGDHPGSMMLPAKVAIDYDNVDVFADRVAPGYEVEYLILVSSQFGPNKINVYGFLKTDE